MSYYYKYNFVSPEPTFIKVKEELRSYFETGAVDDTLFPLHLNYCLRKLGKSSYPINQTVLDIDRYKSSLPEDFHAVREVWMCASYIEGLQLPSTTYTQIVKQQSYKMDTLSQEEVYCRPCDTCPHPDVIEAVYKTTNIVFYKFRKQYLLTPGNIFPSCPDDLYCANLNSVSPHSYDIRDKKIVTTFEEGQVYLQYYSTSSNENEDQLIPDTVEIVDYIEHYLKQKVFEQIYNQTTDETFNQSQQKYLYYKALADEKLVIAMTENKKRDQYRIERAIKKTRNRFKKYNIR